MDNVAHYCDTHQRLQNARDDNDGQTEESLERVLSDMRDNVLSQEDFDELHRRGVI